MAHWTLVAAIAASIGVVIGVAGVALVYFTFRETRKAVREAARGTKAAEDAVAVTRDMGKAQIRAYAIVPNVKIVQCRSLQAFVAKAMVANSGQSPAVNAHVVQSLHIVDDPATPLTQQTVITQKTARIDLGSGTDLSLTFESDVPLTTEHTDMIHARGGAAYLVGSIEYQDVFKDRWIRRFKFFADKTNFNVGSSMNATADGNEETKAES